MIVNRIRINQNPDRAGFRFVLYSFTIYNAIGEFIDAFSQHCELGLHSDQQIGSHSNWETHICDLFINIFQEQPPFSDD